MKYFKKESSMYSIARSIYRFYISLVNKVFPEKYLIKRKFYQRVGYRLDLETPTTFNEKLQWIKVNYRRPLMTICADKYMVRDYVADKIGSEYLIPLVKVFEHYKDIDFDKLPNSFALKASHGSGWNIICKAKNELDRDAFFRKLREWQNKNYYTISKEWVYKDIKPRYVCEELILDQEGKPPKDFKFFCFNGKPKYIQVDLDRFEEHKRNFYDTDWNKLNFELLYSNTNRKVERPDNLDEMIEIAKQLAQEFPFVRVDLYSVKGKVYFGELTFYPENGSGKFSPEMWDLKLGKLIELPNHT